MWLFFFNSESTAFMCTSVHGIAIQPSSCTISIVFSDHLWTMVSKAFLGSTKKTTTLWYLPCYLLPLKCAPPAPMAACMVDLFTLKPYCRLLNRWCFSMFFYCLCRISELWEQSDGPAVGQLFSPSTFEVSHLASENTGYKGFNADLC